MGGEGDGFARKSVRRVPVPVVAAGFALLIHGDMLPRWGELRRGGRSFYSNRIVVGWNVLAAIRPGGEGDGPD